MKIPAAWNGTALDGFRGRVRWRRPFHAPRARGPDERLWLVFDGLDYFADVALNGTPLGRHEGYFERFEFDATSLVGPRNELVVEVDCPAEADDRARRLIRGWRGTGAVPHGGGIWAEVALEVRSFAFLRDVKIRAELAGSRGVIITTGRVVGESAGPVGLDLTADQRPIAGTKIEASPAGAAFELRAELHDVELWWPRNLGLPRTYVVEVELHGRARTLDARRCRVGFRQLHIEPAADWGELNGRRLAVTPIDISELAARLREPDLNDVAAKNLVAAVAPNCDGLSLGRVPGEVHGRRIYDLASTEGLLIWQDFPLAGNVTEAESFAAEAARQARALIRQLCHQPSVALWSPCADAPAAQSAAATAVQREFSQLDPSRPFVLPT